MNPTFRRYLLLFVGGTFALCAVCFLAFSLIPSTPQTAGDIATPRPSNPTSEPSDPAPTATFNAASPEEVAYADFVVLQIERIGEQFREFRRLSDQIGSGGRSVTDNDWRLEMAVVTGEIQAIAEETATYDAPPRFDEMHVEISGAMMKFRDAMDLVQTGLDTFQAELLLQAEELISDGNEQLNAITGELESIQIY